MAAVTVIPPYFNFRNDDGTALNNGYIYIGTAGLDPATNPITVYWDKELTVPATQPIRTINGYYSNAGTPDDIFVNADDFSITVLDSTEQLVFTKLNYNLLLPFNTYLFKNDDLEGADERTIKEKLKDIISIKDYGAIGDGITDDTAAFTEAEAETGDYIYVPDGLYIVTGISLTKTYWGPGTIELNDVNQRNLWDDQVAALTNNTHFYTDSGTANAYVLTTANSVRANLAYVNGMKVPFFAANASTGSAVTANVDGIGSRSVVLPGGGTPRSGDISGYTELVYDSTNTRFQLVDNKLNFPAYSLATNGYVRLDNGLIFQWGVNSGSTGGTTHSYPIAFPSQSYSLVGSSENQAGSIDFQMDQVSASQFRIIVQSGSPQMSWIAVGV